MPKDLSPQKIISMILRHVKLIILVVILTTLVTFGYSKFFITPTYSTSALIIVSNYDEDATVPTSNPTGKTDISNISASAILAKQCVTLFSNVPDMVNLMNGAYVNFTQVDEANFIQISATSANAQQAANVANQLAEAAPVCFGKYFDNGKVEIVRSATAPGAPSSPNITQNTLYGIVIGMILGVLLAFFIEIIDTTIKSGDDLAKTYNIPVFAEIVDFEQEG